CSLQPGPISFAAKWAAPEGFQKIEDAVRLARGPGLFSLESCFDGKHRGLYALFVDREVKQEGVCLVGAIAVKDEVSQTPGDHGVASALYGPYAVGAVG